MTQAFVLGAGLGTRLRPLTNDLPKPLIPIFQKPLITFALDHLIDVGVKRFVINTHKRAELFENYFRDNDYEGHSVALVHEPDLLETGGGIKNAERYLGSDPFLTYSGDILTDANLQPLIEEHFRRDNDVTLALRETGLASDVALLDHRVVDIANRHGTRGNLDFANVAVWNSKIFQQIPPRQKISFIPIVADWIGKGGKIGGVVMNDGKWFNIGSRAEYLEVHRTILREHWVPRYIKTPKWPQRIARSAIVHPCAQVRGCSVVGESCQVDAGAVLEDTILWPGAQIASKSQLDGCIVRLKKKVSGVYRNSDI
jgi:mannose-1-phosphate guanylyltransferase